MKIGSRICSSFLLDSIFLSPVCPSTRFYYASAYWLSIIYSNTTYIASGSGVVIWLPISYINSKTKIRAKNHLNRGKIACFRSHIFSCLLIITVFLSPSCPQVRLRGTKFCTSTYFGHIQLQNCKNLIIRSY